MTPSTKEDGGSAEEGARYLEVLIEEAAGMWLKEHGGCASGGDLQKPMIAFLTDAYKCPGCVSLGSKKSTEVREVREAFLKAGLLFRGWVCS